MASRAQCFTAFDKIVGKLEATSNLAELKDEFVTSMTSDPFGGAAFGWWAHPSPARAPDFHMGVGGVDISEAMVAELAGEHWSRSLPVVDNAVVEGETTSVTLRVALLGPRRRFGVLRAKLLIEIADLSNMENDWRGRFLLLAHVVQQRVGMWSISAGPNLGRREVQCLKLAADGFKAKQIAITLGIGQQTVQFHLSRAREKLDCSNTVQAVARAAQLGLLPDIAPTPATEITRNSETLA